MAKFGIKNFENKGRVKIKGNNNLVTLFDVAVSYEMDVLVAQPFTKDNDGKRTSFDSITVLFKNVPVSESNYSKDDGPSQTYYQLASQEIMNEVHFGVEVANDIEDYNKIAYYILSTPTRKNLLKFSGSDNKNYSGSKPEDVIKAVFEYVEQSEKKEYLAAVVGVNQDGFESPEVPISGTTSDPEVNGREGDANYISSKIDIIDNKVGVGLNEDGQLSLSFLVEQNIVAPDDSDRELIERFLRVTPYIQYREDWGDWSAHDRNLFGSTFSYSWHLVLPVDEFDSVVEPLNNQTANVLVTVDHNNRVHGVDRFIKKINRDLVDFIASNR